MQFNYRGIHYTANPVTLPVVEDEVIGKYRGAKNYLHRSVSVPVARPRQGYTLKYRGASF